MTKIRRLAPTDPDFPSQLRAIPNPPKELYVRGNLAAVIDHPLLAVVGTRKATPYGRQVTYTLVGDLVPEVVIVSGLAIGIDGMAHRACLDGGGKTIAVLAHGLDQFAPASNYHLAQQILDQGGVLISEYPPGTPPHKASFVARNRLVAGLSQAVLITEAAIKSGTYHTAGFALDQGKPVLAVPGNITSYMSSGTNNLIKTGALAVSDASDIRLALGLRPQGAQLELLPANEAEAAVLALLKQGLTDGDQLQHESGLDASNFGQTLTMLEITGKVRSLGGNQWGV